MNEVLEWAERHGLENLRGHIECSSRIAKEAAVTLGWLATVAGASIAFIANSNWSPVAVQIKICLAALALFFLAICSYLVLRCLRIIDVPSPTNEPGNLARIEFSIDQLRQVEIANIQARIKQAVASNIRSSNALNRVRVWAVLGLALAGLAALGVLGIHVVADPAAELQAGTVERASGLTSEVSSNSGQK